MAVPALPMETGVARRLLGICVGKAAGDAIPFLIGDGVDLDAVALDH